jgi:hypothetical protein
MSPRTIWSSKIIETAISANGDGDVDPVVITNPTPVSNNVVNADEASISGSNLDGTSGSPPPTEVPPPSPAPNLTDIKNVSEASAYYKSAVNSALRDPPQTAPDGENYPWRSSMDWFLKTIGIDPNTEKGRQYSKLMASQFNVWYLAVPMAYVIVINWWYTWNYTDFTFDFRSFINYFPFGKWLVEPTFHSIELINYFLLGMRVDSELTSLGVKPEKARRFFRALWDYRPFTFTAFYALVAGLFLFVPGFVSVSDVLAALLMGEPGILVTMIPIIGMIYFWYITVQPERDLEYTIRFFPISIIVKLLFFLISSIAAGLFGTAILGIYLWFISFYAMVYFTFPGFTLSAIYEWPWRLLREFLRIYYDLSEAPVENPETKNVLVKIGNFLFQEFQNLFILIVMCGVILTIHFKNAIEVMEPNPILLIIVIMANLFMVLTVSNGMEITFYKMWIICGDILKSIASADVELPDKGIKE